MALRIGINALYLIPGEVGGTESYLRQLLTALAEIDESNQYFLYVNRETDETLAPAAANFHLIRCAVAARFRPARLIYEQTVLPLLLRKQRISVLFNPGYTAPAAAPCPTVSVFHDLQHKVHPEFFRPLHLPFWNLSLWASARTSGKLIAVSQNTARDLARYLPFATSKIAVVEHGVDPVFFEIAARRGGRTTEPIILTVSTLHPHKNLDRLLHAFARFRTTRPEYRLVIAGLKGFASAQIEDLARSLKLHDSVELTGWIPRADLYALFERADAFIAPSLFEGFGMPLAEALASGIPTACSTLPVFDTVAGAAPLRFDPQSVEAIADALSKITCDEIFRTRASTAGPAQVQCLSWVRTAHLTLEELTNAAAPNRPNREKAPSTPHPPSSN